MSTGGWLLAVSPPTVDASSAAFPYGSSVADTISNTERSALMARIRSKNTGPEMAVRRLVHGLGYRFVGNDRRLPGTPDLAFIARRKVIFVHGCFWHSHDCGRGFRPAANSTFWERKLRRNVERDLQVRGELETLGWGCLTVYECELAAHIVDALAWRLVAFLEA
jgi:DNA mismatch endonuclease, patch repair protein